MRELWLCLVLIMASLAGCTSEDKGTSVHCFDQQRAGSTLTLPAFVQTNCPTIADSVTNSPPSATVTP